MGVSLLTVSSTPPHFLAVLARYKMYFASGTNLEGEPPAIEGRLPRTYTVDAYAKVNLTLDIFGRRADNYHDIATIMQTIDLHDRLIFTEVAHHDIVLTCNREELCNGDNLVMRAAKLLHEYAPEQGVHIELVKHIPSAAGLGGGSSNAAATFLALRNFWGLSITDRQLCDMASSLGSDIPFFLGGGLSICNGRGEQVTSIPPFAPPEMSWYLLLKPAVTLSTADVYSRVHRGDYTDGTHTRLGLNSLMEKRTPDFTHLRNALEPVVLRNYPGIAQARNALLDAGAPFVCLSGSGPTLFSALQHHADARNISNVLRGRGYEVYLAQPIFPDSPGRVSFP